MRIVLLRRGCRRARDRQGRESPLRGGLRPSLTAAARVGAGCAGRDGGMAVLIEQQDDFWSGSVAISTALAGWRGSGRAMIEGRVVFVLTTGCALFAKLVL